MTELDTQALRQALSAPHDPVAPVDVTQIMARGRRLRNRRRLATVAGVVCAIALVAGTATAITNLTAAPSPRVRPAGPAQHGSGQHGPAKHQPPPVGRRTPVPVQRPTAGPPVLPAPTPTSGAATATPSPSGSPAAAPTSTAPLTVTSSPTSIPAASRPRATDGSRVGFLEAGMGVSR
jgi:hypothetical protein